MKSSKFTKLKQYAKELFNKNIKTVDHNFVKRMTYVHHLVSKVDQMYTPVQQFFQASEGKLHFFLMFFVRHVECYRGNGLNPESLLL